VAARCITGDLGGAVAQVAVLALHPGAVDSSIGTIPIKPQISVRIGIAVGTVVQPVDLPTSLNGVMTGEGRAVGKAGVPAEAILNIPLEQFVFLLEPARGRLPSHRY